MLNEVLDGLNIKKDGIYVDCTIGGGGHSEQILKRLSPNGHLYGFDRDLDAIETCKERLKDYKNLTLLHANYKDAKELLNNLGVTQVDGILIDLGVSSYQIDTGERGFSFCMMVSLICEWTGHKKKCLSSGKYIFKGKID